MNFIIFLVTFPDWEEEQVSSPNILRLIYQGRFLHGNVTLGGNELAYRDLLSKLKWKKKDRISLVWEQCKVKIHFLEGLANGIVEIEAEYFLIWTVFQLKL